MTVTEKENVTLKLCLLNISKFGMMGVDWCAFCRQADGGRWTTDGGAFYKHMFISAYVFTRSNIFSY
jgi:hypothetical protein